MIKVKNANKTYVMGEEEVKALQEVSFTVDKGEFVAIVGPSGSGKSTLLHTIGGIDSLDSGTIEVDGEDLSELKEIKLAEYRNKYIGFVFQQFNLQSKYTALENVSLPLVFSGVSKAKRRERAQESLELVDLSDRLEHKPSELSGGQQQRVCIARALVNEPTVVLADEPTGNLDSKTGKKIIQLMKDLNKKEDITMIVVTHDDRVAHMADRIIRFLDGKIVEDVQNGKELIDEFTD